MELLQISHIEFADKEVRIVCLTIVQEVWIVVLESNRNSVGIYLKSSRDICEI